MRDAHGWSSPVKLGKWTTRERTVAPRDFPIQCHVYVLSCFDGLICSFTCRDDLQLLSLSCICSFEVFISVHVFIFLDVINAILLCFMLSYVHPYALISSFMIVYLISLSYVCLYVPSFFVLDVSFVFFTFIHLVVLAYMFLLSRVFFHVLVT